MDDDSLRTLTRNEVAELAGLHVTTIYKLVKRNAIPHARNYKGGIIFTERAIRLWMDSDDYKLLSKLTTKKEKTHGET